MALQCPNRSHPDFKELVEKLGSEDLAYKEWNKEYLDEFSTISVQNSNLKSLKSGSKTISVRQSSKNKYKTGDVLDVIVKRKPTGIKVQVESVTRIEDFSKLPLERKNDFAKSLGDYKSFEDLKMSDDYAREDSPASMQFPDMYKFINGKISGDIIKYSKIEEEFLEGVSFLNPITKEPLNPTDENLKKKFEDKYKVQYVYFKRRLSRLKQDLRSKPDQSEQAIRIQQEIDLIESKINEAQKNQSKQSYIDSGTHLLLNVENYLNDLKTGKKKVNAEDIKYTIEVLNVFDSFTELSSESKRLYEDLEPFIDKITVDEVNINRTEEKEISKEDIDKLSTDINRFTKGVGALSDVRDYIGRTIGAIIKAAQNRVSTKNKKVKNEIQSQVDDLKAYSDKNGIKGNAIYDIFTQELYGTTVLTKEYTSEYYESRNNAFKELNSEDVDLQKRAKAWLKDNTTYNEIKRAVPSKSKYYNENYKKIEETPELKKFYDFHQKIVNESKNKLPSVIGEDFIANIKSSVVSDVLNGEKSILSGFKEAISEIVNVKSFEQGQFVGDEDLIADVVPLKYIKKLSAKEKSKDLGDSLLKFASFANSYEEMSEVLPKARLLQEEIKKKEYIKSSDPSKKVLGEDSNIFKMVDDYIKIQVKGQAKLDEGKISLGKTYDENGELESEKFILSSNIIDFGLKYNSLLKIGLNPISAVTNVLVGDIGNIIESFGDRFYGFKDLRQATNIFFKQNMKEDSVLNKLLEELNPLQELDEYTASDDIRIKGKLSGEGLKNIMYKPQQMGEKFLQTRTMLAVMLKDELITKEGELTERYNKLTKEEKNKFSDKIQRINQYIHGRYSSRDSATLSQNVLFRMASQFKKWIPTALEARFGNKHYDNRLAAEIEGRYQTAFRLLVKDLKGTLNRLKKGELDELEVYNMKKNLTEAVFILGSLLMFNLFKGDDDDDEWRKNPGVKFALDQLNRVSGDLLFFYNPNEYNNLGKNIIPLTKTVSDIIAVARYTPHILYNAGKEEDYQSGVRKGEDKFYSRLGSLVPGYSPLRSSIRYWNGVSFVEPK